MTRTVTASGGQVKLLLSLRYSTYGVLLQVMKPARELCPGVLTYRPRHS